MLRRHGLEGGLGRVIEYYGPALAHLSAMDRHVIANMGAELGATTTVFPPICAPANSCGVSGGEDDWRPSPQNRTPTTTSTTRSTCRRCNR